MLDSTSKQRLRILIGSDGWPCVRLTNFEDYDYLEDRLTEDFELEFSVREILDYQGNAAAYEIVFSKEADLGAIQSVIDSIELPSSR